MDRRLSNPAILNQYDRPKIVVRQAEGQADPTNQLPILFDVEFDEPVLDFPTGRNVPGIVFSGTATGLQYTVEGDRDSFRVAVLSVEHDGTIELSVPDALCADFFGNLNLASTSEDAMVQYDGARPTCLVYSDIEGVANNATLDVYIGFSEPVFGLNDESLTLENAAVSRKAGADGDAIYIFAVTPDQDGAFAFKVPEDAAHDAVGNGNEASPEFSLAVDSTGPEVALTSFETPTASNSRLIRVKAEFNEPVFGFEQQDIAVQRGAVINFTARDDGRTYLFDVRPDRGPVTLSVPAAVASDRIGNPNRASEPFHRDYDPERPDADIVVQSAGRYIGDAVSVEVRFSEPVFGFSDETLKVAGGTAERSSGEDGGATYGYEVRASGRGPVQLSVAEGAVRDAAGNGSRGARARFSLHNRPTPPAPEGEPGVLAPSLNPG